MLRGLAALGVTIFHLTRRPLSLGVPVPVALERWGWIGAYGVHVFFVVSGCVLPLALDRAGYRTRHFPNYLARRLIRIDLPYIASFALPLLVTWTTVGYLAALSPGRPRTPPAIGAADILLHLGYANGFYGVPPLNPVYWTLAIELQFYVIVGLLFGVMASERAIARFGLVVIMVLLSALPLPTGVPLPGKTLILLHLPIFALGIVAFHRLTQRSSASTYILATAAITAFAWWRGGATGTVCAAITSLLIVISPTLSRRLMPDGWTSLRDAVLRPLRYLGTISFSLYLVHLPVGAWLAWTLTEGAPARVLGSSAPVVALGVGLLVSLLTAHLLYVAVERPALRLASRMPRSLG